MGLNFRLIVLGFFGCSLLTVLIADGQNPLGNFKKAVCVVHDETILTNFSCSSKPINRYKTVLNVYGHLTRPVEHVIVYHQMYKKFNVYRPFLVNVTENFCNNFDNTKTKSPYLQIILTIGQKYTNFNHSCPYVGWIIIKDLELDLSSLRLLLPDGEYRYDIQPIINKQKTPAINMQFYFEVGGSRRKKN